MIKKLARWILRDEIHPQILPPSKVMMSLKSIFYHENKNVGMAYAMAIRIMQLYKSDYERCLGTCKDIADDLKSMKDIKKKTEAENE